MPTKSDSRIAAFRAKHERDLRKLITIGCAVAGCAYEGDPETEEAEMEIFVRHVMDLAERTKRTRKHVAAETVALDSKVTPLIRA